jgi:peptidyl-prolyl cis-trans isomerase A (cyclophilin A)
LFNPSNNRFNFIMTFNNTLLTAALCASLSCLSPFAAATIVEFDTVMGPIQVNLYDQTTPKTVENFLAYVSAGDYSNSIFHRSIPGFVVQGGGFIYNNSPTLDSVSANAAVINEPVYSNVRGTIAMAKLEGNANSATNQFYFNLVDNNTIGDSLALDNQNGGFTVFGQVIGDGMAVVDAMAALPRTADFGGLPLRNYPPADTTDFVLTDEHFVIINNIDIIDAATDTAEALNRPLTNRGKSVPTPTTPTSSGGGGHFGLFGLLMLGFAGAMRRVKGQ